MVVFLLILVLGGAAVIWHELPVWMYAVLIVVSGWRMSLRRHARFLASHDDGAPAEARRPENDEERP